MKLRTDVARYMCYICKYCFKFVTHYCTPLSTSHNTVILAYNARYVNTFTIFSAYYMILQHNSVM